MKFKLGTQKEHQFLKRAQHRFEPHHLIPDSRGGEWITSNILQIETYRHLAWHYLFELKTLNEIINYLKSLNSMRCLRKKEFSKNAIYLLFGNFTLDEIIICLMRLRAMKTLQAFKMRLN